MEPLSGNSKSVNKIENTSVVHCKIYPPVGHHALELSPGVTQGEHKSLSSEVFVPPSRMWVWVLEFATLVHQDARGILATHYSTHRIPP